MLSIRLAWLTLAVLALGCASVGNVQRADTIGKGNFQVGLEPGVQVAQVTGVGTIPFPHLDASFRFGVSESVDIGLRAGWSFLEAQGKFLVTKPGDPKLAVSIAPTFGGIALGASGSTIGILHFALPALIGFKFGDNELVLGPRLQGYYVFGSAASGGAGALLLGTGGTVGYAFQVSETVAIMPELGVVVPVFAAAGSTGTMGASGFGIGGVVGQFKLGILIGKRRKALDADDLTPPPPPPNEPSAPPPPLPVR
ncbi:MAG: hypothetical protein Q8N26_21720 [Myxococcales bacterium]|nr:hypothetical protein [Myxococcales bacterium]